MDIKRCFEILEIDAGSSLDEVNQAYRDLVSIWHPDRFSGNIRLQIKSEEKLKEINQAYKKTISFFSSKPDAPKTVHGPKNQSVSYKTYYSDPTQAVSFSKNPSQFKLDAKRASNSKIRPWVRYFARTLDYLILGLLFKSIGLDNLLPKTNIYLLLVPIILSSVWIIPEASLLCIFGTTPGKWILRMNINDIFQLKPRFISALRRSLSVWCNGMGMGVPFIAPITMAVAYFSLKKGRTMWDRDGRFSVIHKSIGVPRVLISFLSSAFIISFLVLGPDLIIEAYIQIARINPDDPEAHYNLGATYANQARCDKAIEPYRKALDIDPDFAQALYGLGICYIDNGRFNEAIDPLNKLIQNNPDHAQAHYNLGLCYHRLLLYEDAIYVLKKAIKTYRDYSLAHYELGLCFFDLERYDSAIETLMEAVRIDPDYSEAYYTLGLCQSRITHYEDAIKNFKKVIDLDPEHAKAYNSLGLCYLEMGHYNKAIETFVHASRIKPDLAEAFYNLGVCYAKLHLPEESIENLKHAINMKPDYAEAYHILGLTYLTLGKKSTAIKQQKILQTLNNDLAKELLYYIDNM